MQHLFNQSGEANNRDSGAARHSEGLTRTLALDPTALGSAGRVVDTGLLP
jgi:hypothetical protein